MWTGPIQVVLLGLMKLVALDALVLGVTNAFSSNSAESPAVEVGSEIGA